MKSIVFPVAVLLGIATIIFVTIIGLDSPDQPEATPRPNTQGPITSGRTKMDLPPGEDPDMPGSVQELGSIVIEESIGIEASFADSSNYYEFVIAHIDSARDGNPDSQYFVYAALQSCDVLNATRLRPDGGVVSIAEQTALWDQHYRDEVKQLVRDKYNRCND